MTDDRRIVKPGALGWAGLVAYVAVADAILITLHQDSMSKSFRRGHWFAVACWTVVSAHLTLPPGSWPDPILAYGKAVRKVFS